MISTVHIMLALAALVGCLVAGMSAEANVEAEQEYQRLFAKKGKAGQPAETLRDLWNLANALEGNQDDVSKTRLEEIKKLLKYKDIVDCDRNTAWSLNLAIDNYDWPIRDAPTIRAYLKDCRSKLFARCNLLLDRNMKATLRSFEDKPTYLQILRFQKFIAANTYELPFITFAHNIKRQLLNYIAKEYDERLNPKMKKEEFDEKFNRTLRQVCSDTKEDLWFIGDYSIFFHSKKVSGQMDSRLKDLARMNSICQTIRINPEEVSEYLFKQLTRS